MVVLQQTLKVISHLDLTAALAIKLMRENILKRFDINKRKSRVINRKNFITNEESLTQDKKIDSIFHR